MSDATPDIAGLSLDGEKERQTFPSGKKRRAESEIRLRGKNVSHLEYFGPESARDIPYTSRSNMSHAQAHDGRIFNPTKGNKNIEAHVDKQEDDKLATFAMPPTSNMANDSGQSNSQTPGLIELQKYDPRYPDLLLQPDSRPISQEQLASEVKSIYAGLAMVKRMCLQHEPKLSPDQWQALNKHQRIMDSLEGTDTANTTLQPSKSKGAYISTYEIPSVVNGHFGPLKFKALGDTCAMFNFMSATCATWLGLNIDTTTSKLVTIGSGDQVKTAGIVSTSYQFRDEPERSYPLLFHIVPNFVQDIVLGRTFLKNTETFTKKYNMLRRVKKTIVKTLRQYRLMYLGDRAPKFLGLLDGKFVDALADTGSNVLIMDEDFARERGLLVRRGRGYRTRLMFADGTTKMTSGMTRKVPWQFGASEESPKHLLEFHVLKNSPAPVILNDSLLFDTNAYEEYDAFLLDEGDEDEDEDGEAYFFHISYDFNYDAQGMFAYHSM